MTVIFSFTVTQKKKASQNDKKIKNINKSEEETDKKNNKFKVQPAATIASKNEKKSLKPIAAPVIINTPELSKEDNDNYRAVVYSVKKRDNLGYIASWFHCKVKEIRKWNELSGNFIDVEDELLIYVHNNDYKKFIRFNYLSNRLKDMLSSKIQTQEELDAIIVTKTAKDSSRLIDKINPVKIFSKNKDCFEVHKIRSGENLWSIAQKYDDVTVQDLMQWNGYKKTPVLHKGDEIKVRKIVCK